MEEALERGEVDARVFDAVDCAVIVPGERVECTSVAGLGSDHAWTLRVDGRTVARAARTSYAVGPGSFVSSG